MSAVLERDRKRQRKAKRLRGIEPLERRDVVGEWLVGLAGVGLAATAEAQRWDSEPIAEGSSATVELGTSVDRGLACIVSDSPRSPITAPDFQVSQSTNPQAANDTASDGTLPAQRGFTTADVSAFEQLGYAQLFRPGWIAFFSRLGCRNLTPDLRPARRRLGRDAERRARVWACRRLRR